MIVAARPLTRTGYTVRTQVDGIEEQVADVIRILATRIGHIAIK
jgi:hypothetical protein